MLNQLFQPVIELFQLSQDSEGESLAYCLNEDWDIFSDHLTLDEQNELLDEIRFGDLRPKERYLEDNSSELWIPNSDLFYGSRSEEWSEFSYHIRYKRRFILAPSEEDRFTDPRKWLPSLLKGITKMYSPKARFFRARRGGNKEKYKVIEPYAAKDMEAPPPEKAVYGRANPPGIAYLYAAEDEKTAISEVRPHVGELVTLAKLHPKRELRIVDLTKVPKVRSAFESNLHEQIERTKILRALNHELARPVHPDESAVRYVPCQYLAEIILDAGMDGILYSSSVSDSGNNLVLFFPNSVEFEEETGFVKISKVDVSYYRR